MADPENKAARASPKQKSSLFYTESELFHTAMFYAKIAILLRFSHLRLLYNFKTAKKRLLPEESSHILNYAHSRLVVSPFHSQ